MKKSKVLLTVVTGLLFAGTSALAEGGSGSGTHGGSVLACFKSASAAAKVKERIIANRKGERRDPLTPAALSALKSVELFDLYLARMSNALEKKTDLIEANGRSYLDIVKDREEKLRVTHRPFYQLVSQARESLDLSSWRGSENGLIEINDTGSMVTFPDECLLLQLAVQDILPGGKAVIYYDTRLFSRMKSSLDQAGIFLHEWIYHAFIKETEARNARGTQLTLGEVFKKDFGADSTPEFHSFLSSLGLFRNLVVRCHTVGSAEYCLDQKDHFINSPTPHDPLRQLIGADIERYRYTPKDRVIGDGRPSHLYTYFAQPVIYDGRYYAMLAFYEGKNVPFAGALMPGQMPSFSYDVSRVYPYTQENIVRFDEEGKMQSMAFVLTAPWRFRDIDFQAKDVIEISSGYSVVGADMTRNGVGRQLPGTGLYCSQIKWAESTETDQAEECQAVEGSGLNGAAVMGRVALKDRYEIDWARSDLRLGGASKFWPGKNIRVEYTVRANGSRRVSAVENAGSESNPRTVFVISDGTYETKCHADRLEFHENGQLKKCTSVASTYHAYGLPRLEVAEGEITFHANGKLATFIQGSTGQDDRIQGKRVKPGDRVVFDEAGKLVRIERE